MNRAVILLLCLVGIAGCANFGVIKYNDAINYPPTDPSMVKIFNSEPPQAYEKIAELTCQAAPASNMNSITKHFQEEAAKMGADAVIVNTNLVLQGAMHNLNTTGSYSGNSSGGNFNANTFGNSTAMYKKNVLGIAIKFKDK
ncbi:MAG: hypothetical protein WC543_04245 [Candidatus Omnitrophota bacterium]